MIISERCRDGKRTILAGPPLYCVHTSLRRLLGKFNANLIIFRDCDKLNIVFTTFKKTHYYYVVVVLGV